MSSRFARGTNVPCVNTRSRGVGHSLPRWSLFGVLLLKLMTVIKKSFRNDICCLTTLKMPSPRMDPTNQASQCHVCLVFINDAVLCETRSMMLLHHPTPYLRIFEAITIYNGIFTRRNQTSNCCCQSENGFLWTGWLFIGRFRRTTL